MTIVRGAPDVAAAARSDEGGTGDRSAALVRADHTRHRSVRRLTAALIVTALVAFAIVATAAVLIAKRIARDDALHEAVRVAQNTADVLFAPTMPGVLVGDPAAVAKLDEAVNVRRERGLIARVKVWDLSGRILYSDDRAAVGRRFELEPDVRAAINRGTSRADISDLQEEENVTEVGLADRLVEVYTPLTLADGRRFAFELYSSYDRVSAHEHRLIRQIVPFALLSLAVLIILQLPVSVWLVRRVANASAERAALLGRVLTVSDNERRSIAHDLHDGVVQQLAGVGYALNALSARIPADSKDDTGQLYARMTGALQDSVRSLRTLIVDIYPPDLNMAGMAAALEDLAVPLRAAGVAVDVEVGKSAASAPASSDAIAMLYRSARECITNVAKHAHAGRVGITLRRTNEVIVLSVEDDGVGLPAGAIERRDGHLGLRLLRDAIEHMGGGLIASSRAPRGASIVIEVPIDGVAGF
jgi:two-component system NarL family sensor kinase